MNQKELKELIEFLIEKDIAEFELERDDVKLRVKRPKPAVSASETTFVAAPYPASYPMPIAPAMPAPAAPPPVPSAAPAATTAAAAPAAAASEVGIEVIKSPIVGTFYEAASPGAPPFVKRGDQVKVGQVLCIVEAMKLMNEIEAEKAGEIVDILVSNGQPVEYGQPLFKIRVR
jgi:acetyl-CoA carboxylase biotin carboxyl carrier protein